MKKKVFLFGALVLFSVFLIGVVSADYSIDSLSRRYSGYGSTPWYNVIEDGNVIISASKSGVNYFSTEGNWLPINAKTDELKLSVNGEYNQEGEDPRSGFQVRYRVWENTGVRVKTKIWGDTSWWWLMYGHKYEGFDFSVRMNRIDTFQRESDTSILINGVSHTINIGDSYEIQNVNWAPGGHGSAYSFLKINNLDQGYFEIHQEVWEYDEEYDSAHVRIESYIEGIEPVCGNDVLEEGEGCDDGNTEDGDGCSSECLIEPEPPECCRDSDCSEDYYSDKYCSGDDVYTDFHDFFCEDGECFEDIINELVEECSYDCVDGECIDEPVEPECYVDSDCGIDHCLGEANYCFDGDVYQDYMVYTCNNPGEPDAYCSSDFIAWLLESCECGCENSECLECPEPPEPVCGDGILEEGEECEIDCDCGEGYYCDGCLCYEEPEPPEECCNDEDCSEDYYSDKYCDGGDVYKDFHDWSCVDDECVENVISKLVEECDDECSNGECVEDDNKRSSSHDNCCDWRHDDCEDYDGELLTFYDESELKDYETNEVVLIGQSKVRVENNNWVMYLFIGCIVLLVLILICLAVKR